MFKKIATWITVLALVFTGGAFAEALDRAGDGLDIKALERCWSWTVNDAGDFSVVSNGAASLVEQFAALARTGFSAGTITFVMELRGNTKTRVCYPVLKILYLGSVVINCKAVSIVIDGTRYDFAASTADYSGARGRAETISVYLDEEGLAVMRALGRASVASISLSGTESQFVTNLERRDETYNSIKPRLESGALNVLKLPEGSPDFEAYGMTDLALSTHLSKGGVKPCMSKAAVNAESPIPTEATFGFIGVGSQGAHIRQLHELLIANYFFTGVLNYNITVSVRTAVMRAQKYYGLMQTGSADALLINLMSGKRAEAKPESEPAPEKWSAQSDSVAYRLDRWWLADSADTSTPAAPPAPSSEGSAGTSSASQARVPADADNTLIIVDGWVRSLSASAMSLSFEASAVFTYNGKYDFAAQLFCENNAGTGFTSTLGALANSRMLVYAEIPAYLVAEGGAWTLSINIDGVTSEYELK